MASAPAPTLTALNTSQSAPTSFPFTLLAPPKTDLWVKPRSFDSPPDVSPIHASNQSTFFTTVKLSQLLRASVSFSYQPTVLYDQAGLVLLFGSDEKKWIKAGLEQYNGEPKRGIVSSPGNGLSADWSMAPPVKNSVDLTGRVRALVEVEREADGTRSSLFVKIGGEMIREVTWVFAGEDEEVKVGFYAARPLGRGRGIWRLWLRGGRLRRSRGSVERSVLN